MICPLNWGLGHAARCIPIAEELLKQGYQVDFSSDGSALELLRNEFPGSRFFTLPGYGITYPGKNMLINIGQKLTGLLKTIRLEHRTVNQIVEREGYDIVISDNRYGCYSQKVYSIFITHQLHILSPADILDPAVNRANHHFIGKYNECWIPDLPEPPGLTGKLAHGHRLPDTCFIGPVSRFRKLRLPEKYKLTAVLSGPEPQRSVWEKALTDQLTSLPYPTVLIQGKVSGKPVITQNKNLTVYSFLPAAELNEIMSASEIIVCRGGYTTIMDLTVLGKKAICIPTPGQTEQEYLTQLYADRKYLLRQTQDRMDIVEAINRLPEYTGLPAFPSDLLQQTIARLPARMGNG